KSMRGGDADASVYYLAAMLEGGEDARFVARRMVVLASEDIGNADPRALLVAVAAAQAVEHVGLPEARLNLAQAAIYLARAPKSNASYVAVKEATKDVRELGNVKPAKALQREGVPLVLNELDRRAVAEAVRLREAAGGEVVVMTMGPPQAEEALRECLALGAERCIHLSDRVFALADTIGTSRTLALALRKEGSDLVLCGRKALDAETRQVPPEVAAFLGRPHVTNSVGLAVERDNLRVRRETDD